MIKEKDIRQAAKLYYLGNVTYTDIAKLYNTSPSSICEIWAMSPYWKDEIEKLSAIASDTRLIKNRKDFEKKLDFKQQKLNLICDSFIQISIKINSEIMTLLAKDDVKMDMKKAQLLKTLIQGSSLASTRAEALTNELYAIDLISNKITEDMENEEN
jgi:hypothetical protein